MGFSIKKEVFKNKTFRLPESLLKECSEIANKNGISINEFVRQSLRFAIDNLEFPTENTDSFTDADSLTVKDLSEIIRASNKTDSPDGE